MTTSVRQQIVSAIDTRLKTVLVSGGYETNLGRSVDWYVLPPLSPEDLPALCLKDRDGLSWAGVGEHQHDLEVAVEIYLAPERATAAATMRKAIADIIKSIGVDVTWGGLAQDTLLPREERLFIEERGEMLAAVGFAFTVVFVTSPWNPYA